MGKENVKTSSNVQAEGGAAKAKKKEKKPTAKDAHKATKAKAAKAAPVEEERPSEEVVPETTAEATPEATIASLVGALKESDKLAKVLEDVREPREKSRIADDIKELAWRLKAQIEGYKFEARGSLFSDVVEHVAAAECHLVRDSKGPLPSEDCGELWNLARHELEHVGGICVSWTSADGKSHEAWGPQHLKRSDIVSVVVTGARKVPGGWMLPTTLELGVSHSKRADAVKIADVCESLDRGDYASVVAALEDFFKHKKRVREALVAADNAHLGRLRFVVSQFQMLDDNFGPKARDKALEYVRNAIGGLNLEWYAEDPSTKKANDALQARAKVILKTLYPVFGPQIKPASQRELFAAAYDRTLGR